MTQAVVGGKLKQILQEAANPTDYVAANNYCSIIYTEAVKQAVAIQSNVEVHIHLESHKSFCWATSQHV